MWAAMLIGMAAYDGLNNNKITFSGKNVDIRKGTVTLDEVLGKWVVT